MLNGTGLFKRSALLILLAIAPATAQDLRRLTRATSVTGLNDSALTLASDSARRTRAASIAQFRKALSVKAFDSLVATGASRFPGGITVSSCVGCAPAVVDSATGAVRAQTLTTARSLWGQSFNGSADVTGSLTSVANITGGASSMTVQAGTGVSRTLTLQTTTSAGTAKSTLTLGADTSITPLGQIKAYDSFGSPGPPYSFAAQANLGFARANNNLSCMVVAGNCTANFGSTAIQNQVGSGASPSYSFTNGLSTGLSLVDNGSTDTLVTSVNGVVRAQFTNSGIRMVNGVVQSTTGSASGPSFAFDGDANNGIYRIGADTLGVTSAGNLVSRFTRNGAAATIQVDGVGDVGTPSYTWVNDPNTGMYNGGADTLLLSTGGALSLGVRGGSSPTWFGGTGNTTIQAGTGNSRKLILQTTTSAGTATTAIRFNEIQQSLHADGTNTAPSIGFASDTATGIYTDVAGRIAFTTIGTKRMHINSGGLIPNNDNAVALGTSGLRWSTVNGIAYLGTATNDNAASGMIGEYMTHQTVTGSSVSLTTNTTANVDSLTLTAGDWDVYGVVDFTFGATTSYTYAAGGVSSTSATLVADQGFAHTTPAEVPVNTNDQSYPIAPTRFSVSGSTKVYLVARSTFTVSTLKAYGTISARRAR